jgi:hypothetical protein
MSEALRTKAEVPWFDGHPVREDPIKERPAGRAPEASAHVYGGVPPWAWSVAVYERPVLAVGRVMVEIVMGSRTVKRI